MKRITIEKVIDELKKEADNLLEKWINEGKVFINSNKYYDYSYSKSSSNEIGLSLIHI